MRKLLVGLLVLGLLAAASPAMAQLPTALLGQGGGDPLGLLASGAVMPYFGAGAANCAGGCSFLELYAPRRATNVHMFFYDENCVRQGDSVNIFLTPNDVEWLFRVDNIGGANPTRGLIAMADVDASGFNLLPWPEWAGVQAKLWWHDPAKQFVRIVEPIAVDTWDGRVASFWTGYDSPHYYSPMKTSATFWAPPETGSINTELYFVCPTTDVIGTSASAGLSTTREFPGLYPAARVRSAGPTPIRIRVYDDDEGFLRDVRKTCICLETKKVTDINNVYSNTSLAPGGTYSEVFGATESGTTPATCDSNIIEQLTSPPKPNAGNSCPLVYDSQNNPIGQYKQLTPASGPAGGPYSFVLYRSIRFQASGNDVFGRQGGVAKDAIDDLFGGTFGTIINDQLDICHPWSFAQPCIDNNGKPVPDPFNGR